MAHTTDDYAEFDKALLAHIKAGKSTAGQLLQQNDLQDLSKPFCTIRTDTERIIDRRLQFLRKKERIAFTNRHGWQLLKKD